MPGPLRVALALGSGGARGYAHIGAIEAIEARGLEIVTVAGSSMGAAVGGLHAAGRLDDYAELARSLTQLDVVRFLDVSLSAPGAIRAERIVAVVRDLIGDVRIEDLPIAYTAVATDLLAGREVWFQEGLVDTAIRASISIPGVITPVVLNGRLLVDGGVLDPVPIAPTAAVATDLTIAVSLTGDGSEQRTAAAVHDVAEARPIDEWRERLRRGTARVRDSDAARSILERLGRGEDADVGQAVDDLVDVVATGELDAHGHELVTVLDEASTGDVGDGEVDAAIADAARSTRDDVFGELPARLGKLDVMGLSLDMMQRVMLRHRLAMYPPDVLVAVPRDACRSLDYHRADEMIALGRSLADEALDAAGITDGVADD